MLLNKIRFQLFLKQFLAAFVILLAGCSSGHKVDYGAAPVREGASLSIAEGGAINVKKHRYTVHKGDTLYSIAWALGIDYRDLAQANNLHSPYALHRGQVVNLDLTRVIKHNEKSSHVIVAPKRPVIAKRAAAQRSNSEKNKNIIYQKTKKWRWPARGHIIKHFSRHSASGESGIDIKGRLGEPIRASASGEIVYSGKGIRGYGNLLIIKHSASVLSAYAYNAKLLVKTGEHVAVGQKIALMGRSPVGRTSLHFEIRRNGRPVNPMRYLR